MPSRLTGPVPRGAGSRVVPGRDSGDDGRGSVCRGSVCCAARSEHPAPTLPRRTARTSRPAIRLRLTRSTVRGHAEGSVTVNVDPSPSWEATSIRPPWRVTMRWTIARPRPVPGRASASGLVERKKSLNRWCWSAAEMPRPWSAHDEDDVAPRPAQREPHLAVRAGVLDRVAHEVAQEPAQLLAVPGHGQLRVAGGQDHPRRVAARGRADVLDHLGEERSEGDPAAGAGMRGCLHPGQQQQVVGERPGAGPSCAPMARERAAPTCSGRPGRRLRASRGGR